MDKSGGNQADVQYAALHWQSPDHIKYERGPVWYTIFAVVVVALLVAAIVLKQYIFAGLVPIMAVALFLYIRKTENSTHDYAVTNEGVYIDSILYPFSAFKNFGVVEGHDHPMVRLTPNDRFKVMLTLYFPIEKGEELVDVLAQYLPMVKMSPDFFDIILHKLRI